MILNFFKKKGEKDEDSIDIDFFREVSLLKKLTAKEIRRFSNLFITKKFQQNEEIFREHYPHVVFYIIKSGKVKLYHDAVDSGTETLIEVMGSKDIFGELGVFADINRVFSAAALENTELIAINKTDFINFAKNNPGTGIKLMWNLSQLTIKKLLTEIEKLDDHEKK